MGWLHGAAEWAAGMFAPLRCAGCDLAGPRAVCAACTAALIRSRVPNRRTEHGVAWIAAFEYEDPLRPMIHRAKYRGARRALDELSALAARRVASALQREGGVLVAVPLSPRRERRRGYNQAQVVASAFAAAAGLRVISGIVRLRDTPPQAEKNELERRRNVASAFAWRGASLAGASMWLVDDVVTTGATALAARQTLVDAGAAQVDVASIASVP